MTRVLPENRAQTHTGTQGAQVEPSQRGRAERALLTCMYCRLAD